MKINYYLKQSCVSFVKRIFPTYWKERSELTYWKSRMKEENILSNMHYKYFYTTHFELEDAFYNDKVILDIGCGPRGSLEWASMATRRIGLDPLAAEYQQFGTNRHMMEYIDAGAENIPLKESECDAVFSFNSLDHVKNVERAIEEIKRITRIDGIFLLLVEVNHPPTDCEPHYLTPTGIIESLEPEFHCDKLKVYKPNGQGLYQSILEDEKLPFPESTNEIGYMSAKFTRMATKQ